MTKRMAGMLAVMVLAVQAAGAQTSGAKDDLFAGTEKFAKNAVSVTEVTMDPESLGLVDGKDKDKAKGMKLNVVRTYTYDKPGQYEMADVEAFRSKLMTGDWHCSVHIRDLKNGNSTDVCRKTRTDDMVESAIVTVEPKQLTFVHSIGAKGSRGGLFGSYGNWSDNELGALGGWRVTGPEAQANMVIARAEMQANMAEMRATMAAERAAMGSTSGRTIVNLEGMKLDGLDSNGLKNFDRRKGLEKLELKHYDGWDVKGQVLPTPKLEAMPVPKVLLVPAVPQVAEPQM